MHRAVDISVGGLSPTINWSKLKNEEFLIPCENEQAALAALLEASDEMVVSRKNSMTALEQLLKVKARNILLGSRGAVFAKSGLKKLPPNWKTVEVGEIFEKITSKNKDQACTNVLTISAKDGLVSQEDYFTRNVASKNLSNYYLLQSGDFAYNKSYSFGYPAGAIKIYDRRELGLVSPLYICFRLRADQHYSGYFRHLFEAGFLNGQVLSVAKEGARNHGLLNVASSDFFKLKLPYPEQSDMVRVVRELEAIERRIDEFSLNYEMSLSLKESLINQIF